MDQSQLVTRFDEQTFTTGAPENCRDMVLARPITRNWTEDFVDEDTGETVAIERSEILLNAGAVLTPDVISQIRFHMAEAGVSEIHVSNQRRTGTCTDLGAAQWLCRIACCGSTTVLHLVARDIVMAEQIARDFAEQVLSGALRIERIEHVDFLFVPLPECAPEEDAEGQPIVREYYKVSVAMALDPDSKPILWRYITLARNADEASQTIRDYRALVRAEAERENKPMVCEERIKKVSPIAIDYIVPNMFYQAYNQSLCTKH